jgi:hypothetical protein
VLAFGEWPDQQQHDVVVVAAVAKKERGKALRNGFRQARLAKIHSENQFISS